MSSDRITWEICPVCGRPAAVGWLDVEAAEFDCTAGCLPSIAQVRELCAGRSLALDWLTRRRPVPVGGPERAAVVRPPHLPGAVQA
jgi:hypothetical protein